MKTVTIKARYLKPGDMFRKKQGHLVYMVISENDTGFSSDRVIGVNNRGRTTGINKNHQVVLVKKHVPHEECDLEFPCETKRSRRVTIQLDPLCVIVDDRGGDE